MSTANSPESQPVRRNRLRTLVSVTLLAVLVYATMAISSDLGALRTVLQRFRWWTLAAALALSLCNYGLRFAKWQYYLAKLGIHRHAEGSEVAGARKALPLGESLVIFIAGFSMSITPGKAGEVFRSALLASAHNTPVPRSAPIVIADRASDLLALVVLVAAGTTSFRGYAWIALTGLGLVAIAMAFVVLERPAELVFSIIERWAIGQKMSKRLRDAHLALRVVMSPSALVIATSVSVLAWGLECMGLYLLLWGLGSPVSLGLAVFVYSTATIAGALAMLPGGLGGTELVMRSMLSVLGAVLAAPAAAATLLARLSTLWFGVALGFVSLAYFRARLDRQLDNVPQSAPTSSTAQ
ncbi:MAG: lysylphosphatidylglycerol synthase transmembrane domain-containing protein [Deltaproteobacteria bacterium]|nr:lysylphosphatidylglycerol synthase transmembrane domain-containing protein [Deltaproteobacteria bacterium]